MGPLWEESEGIQVRVHAEADVCRVTVTGDIDLLSAPELKLALQDVVSRGCRHAVVDLTGVPYIDSSGYGALLSGVKHLRIVEGTLCLVGCSGTVRRMLEVTRLGTLFHICTTFDEAQAVIASNTVPRAALSCRAFTPRAADA